MKRTWISAVLAAALTLVLITALGGCGRTDEQPVMSDTGRFSVIAKSDGWSSYWQIIEDTETGAQYLFWKRDYSGGLTPLLDADGKPALRQ